MTIEDTKKLIKKIKMFRPFFQTGNSTREDDTFAKEWFKILEPYSSIDINTNLEIYFKNSNNFGKTPEPFQLIHGCVTEKEKIKLNDKNSIRVRCPICGKVFGLSVLDDHYGRCSSIDYLVKNQKKYFDKDVSEETIQKLFEASDEKFDEVYMNFIKRLKPVVDTGNELDAINKLLNENDCDILLGSTVTGLKKQMGGNDEK